MKKMTKEELVRKRKNLGLKVNELSHLLGIGNNSFFRYAREPDKMPRSVAFSIRKITKDDQRVKDAKNLKPHSVLRDSNEYPDWALSQFNAELERLGLDTATEHTIAKLLDCSKSAVQRYKSKGEFRNTIPRHILIFLSLCDDNDVIVMEAKG
tara:strand:+ start:7137 stop:7595 length:459 start_codon:yes stop_codon:yes gene_type:complete